MLSTLILIEKQQNGNASVLLNAVNAPSTLTPYDAVNFTQFLGSFRNEMINPLAQISNTYNDFNFKQLR
jgi:hypothetical protein